MKKYRAAIIGCGNIASLFDKDPKASKAFTHAGAYQLCDRTELVAACDIDKSKAEAFAAKWGIKKVFTDYQQMLKEESIDILSVCTPPATHFPIVREAVNLPLKAIYCEKPIALNTQEAQQMVELCRQKNVLLMINHQRRFGPFWREVRDKFQQGLLGEIQQVTCYYTRGIHNTGVHILDLFVFLFGKPCWVRANTSKNKSPFPQDPNIEGEIGFESGLVASLKPCDDAHYLILEIDVLGSKGRLRIGSQVEYFNVTASDNLLGKNELKREEASPFKTAYGPIPLTWGVEHILNCLEGKDQPLSSGNEAIAVVGIIEALLKSVEQQKTINIGV